MNAPAFAFPRADLFSLSAKWWSYLVPPVEHPLLAQRSMACGTRLAWLGAARTAGEHRLGRHRFGRLQYSAGRGPERDTLRGHLTRAVLVIIAMVALVCSLSPERTVWGMTFIDLPQLLTTDADVPFVARFGGRANHGRTTGGHRLDSLRRTRSRPADHRCHARHLAAGVSGVAPALWRDALRHARTGGLNQTDRCGY